MARGTLYRLGFVRERAVRELMRRRCITITPEETLDEACRLMRLARIRHLPVVRDGILVGVVTYRDVLEARIARLEEPGSRKSAAPLNSLPVSRLIRHPPETVPPDCSLGEVAGRMFRLKVGCLPVVEPSARGSRLLGLVTESDLLLAAYDPGLVWESQG